MGSEGDESGGGARTVCERGLCIARGWTGTDGASRTMLTAVLERIRSRHTVRVQGKTCTRQDISSRPATGLVVIENGAILLYC